MSKEIAPELIKKIGSLICDDSKNSEDVFKEIQDVAQEIFTSRSFSKLLLEQYEGHTLLVQMICHKKLVLFNSSNDVCVGSGIRVCLEHIDFIQLIDQIESYGGLESIKTFLSDITKPSHFSTDLPQRALTAAAKKVFDTSDSKYQDLRDLPDVKLSLIIYAIQNGSYDFLDQTPPLEFLQNCCKAWSAFRRGSEPQGALMEPLRKFPLNKVLAFFDYANSRWNDIKLVQPSNGVFLNEANKQYEYTNQKELDEQKQQMVAVSKNMLQYVTKIFSAHPEVLLYLMFTQPPLLGMTSKDDLLLTYKNSLTERGQKEKAFIKIYDLSSKPNSTPVKNQATQVDEDYNSPLQLLTPINQAHDSPKVAKRETKQSSIEKLIKDGKAVELAMLIPTTLESFDLRKSLYNAMFEGLRQEGKDGPFHEAFKILLLPIFGGMGDEQSSTLLKFYKANNAETQTTSDDVDSQYVQTMDNLTEQLETLAGIVEHHD